MSPIRTILSLLLGLTFTLAGSSVFAQDYQNLLKQYQEPQKSEMNRAIQLTTQKYSGRVIGVSKRVGAPKKTYRIKMLNDSGRLKTYYVDERLMDVSP